MQSQKTLMTAEELLRLPDTEHRYELIAGRLVTMPPGGAEHGAVAMNLAYYLTAHVMRGRLGEVFAADTGFILRHNPDTVRAPDVAFIRKERLPEGGLPATFCSSLPISWPRSSRRATALPKCRQRSRRPVCLRASM